jgi:hypothetical protein
MDPPHQNTGKIYSFDSIANAHDLLHGIIFSPQELEIDSCIAHDARHLRRERDRFRAASMTDEQREEKNRKRREEYKRKKCHPNNKKNDPRIVLSCAHFSLLSFAI